MINSTFSCNLGYYCDNNNAPITNYTMYPCPIGHYCLNGTEWDTQYGCPAGTYNPYKRLEREDQCTPCDKGKYCNTTGRYTVEGRCFNQVKATGLQCHAVHIILPLSIHLSVCPGKIVCHTI